MSEFSVVTIGRFDRIMLLVKKHLLIFLTLQTLVVLLPLYFSINMIDDKQPVLLMGLVILLIPIIVEWHIYVWWDAKFQYRSVAIIENPPAITRSLQERMSYWVRNFNSGNGMDLIADNVVEKIYSGKPLNRKECTRLREIIDMYSRMETQGDSDERRKLQEILAPLCEKLTVTAQELDIQDKKILEIVQHRLRYEALVEADDIASKHLKLAIWTTTAAGMSAIAAIFSAIAAFKTCN